ncbi:glycosyl hydrolase family 28-related protein [Paenibacillus sedimenti]|uniref:Right-handed parallel beta-helix repeat-containing protein n=1 Tax=Paenibacillus sedimenti TaxID=2770274 RepID=A0A926QKB7_9BACL|nr:glycosyl hydrolase family 28-related protein [Paenibacillus sedimenti]MBD0381309.1 right-handed parallel beta-helix repeat-containing protein [Paenibacillus sedimenti]
MSGQFFDITDYGAVGNGTTDNRANIQAAIDDCSTSGGGSVYVPNGTYLISSALTIPSKVSLFGNGEPSEIKPASGAAYAGSAVINTNGQDSSISNLKLSLNNSGEIGINIAGGTSKLRIDKVYFSNGSQGIAFNNDPLMPVNDTIITDCKFDKSGYGVLLYATSKGKGLIIRGCYFFNGGYDYFESNRADFTDIVIINNKFDTFTTTGASDGFAIGIARGNGITITGNQFYGIQREAIHIENSSKDIVVFNNKFDECGYSFSDISVNNKVINCISGSTNINIYKNSFKNTGRRGTAIYMGASGGINGSKYSVYNNVFAGFRAAIVNDEQKQCEYVRNEISDCDKAFGGFKLFSQTYMSNIITNCSFGFSYTGYNLYWSPTETRNVYLDNKLVNVTTPFKTDENPGYMQRTFLWNQGM